MYTALSSLQSVSGQWTTQEFSFMEIGKSLNLEKVYTYFSVLLSAVKEKVKLSM